jgi:hypothetical protein
MRLAVPAKQLTWRLATLANALDALQVFLGYAGQSAPGPTRRRR